MAWINLIQLLTFFISAGLGIFVLLKNPRSAAHRYFALFAIAVGFVSLSIFLLLGFRLSPAGALFAGRAVIIFGSIFSSGLLIFSFSFPHRDPRYEIRMRIALIMGIAFAALSYFTVQWVAVRNGYIMGKFTILQIPWAAYILATFLYSFVRLLRKYKRLRGSEHEQVRWVIIGLVLFIIPVAITNLILPNVFGIFKYNNLGPVFTIPMIIVISYAIVRHRFLDIRVVIQRGLVFAAILALIVAFYLAVIFGLETLFAAGDGAASLLGGVITAIVGIVTVPAIDRSFRRRTDSFFFKDKYTYSEALYELSDVLNKNLDLHKLRTRMEDALVRIFRAEAASVILEGEPRESWTGDAIPITLESALLGTIVMGAKRSGDAYTDEDITLLKTFSIQAAVAIEKAKLYEKIKHHSRELEERVEERTAELRSLQEGQRRMMVDISHGLQTPLTVVKGELESLRAGSADTAKINRLQESIDKVSKSIYDLLKLARLESHGVDFKEESIEFSTLLKHIVEYVETIAEGKGIVLSHDIAPDIRVRGDEQRLEELATALISNAMKYMGNAPNKEVRVELKRREHDAELLVTDTGAGIDPEDLPHIFERFYRAKSKGVHGPEGTGLGLAIAKTIAEKHGGSVRAEGEPGKGARFIVRLPLERLTE